MSKKKKFPNCGTGVFAELRAAPLPYRVWGAQHIDSEARKQMDNALRLPVSSAGALMPDAHVGYGLPIGGVLATENAVIPYAVGVDIACRMRMSVFPISPIVIGQKPGQFRKALMEGTRFGAGATFSRQEQVEHPIFDDEDWRSTDLLRSLQATAFAQLGTSGTGNHFVEWGSFSVEVRDEALDLDRGQYLALLSHSGSRGVGFKIANFYSRLAQDMRPDLDSSVRQLAWFEMDGHYGQEYWLSMELAGRFASANHEVIHRRLAKAIGQKPVAVVENYHNFAWRETISAPKGSSEVAREVIVHRKGATPAAEGVYGIIPGSMGDAGYVVRGRGLPEALNSASHGSGRAMSRHQAEASITRSLRDQYLRERGVTLIGGSIDESPQAYKPIDDIIGAQSDLVDVIGKFMPIMVRMAEERGDS
jgi:tRNA-splicing ligase RtcB